MGKNELLNAEELKVINLFRQLERKDKDKIVGMLELKYHETLKVNIVMLFICQIIIKTTNYKPHLLNYT